MVAALLLLLASTGAVGARRSELWTPEEVIASGIDVSEHAHSPRPHEWLNPVDIPQSFSWMNVSGVNYLTKMLNQHIPQCECLVPHLIRFNH